MFPLISFTLLALTTSSLCLSSICSFLRWNCESVCRSLHASVFLSSYVSLNHVRRLATFCSCSPVCRLSLLVSLPICLPACHLELNIHKEKQSQCQTMRYSTICALSIYASLF